MPYISACGHQGYTLLSKALNWKNALLVKMLLDYGADPNVKGNFDPLIVTTLEFNNFEFVFYRIG